MSLTQASPFRWLDSWLPRVQIHSISNRIDQRQLQFSKNVMFYLDLKHFDDNEGPQDSDL